MALFSPLAGQPGADTPTSAASASTPIIKDWHANAIPQAVSASAASSAAGGSRRSSGGGSPRRRTHTPQWDSVVPVAVLGYGPGYKHHVSKVGRDRLIMSALQLMEPAAASAVPPELRQTVSQLGLAQALLNGNLLASTATKLEADCIGVSAHTVGDASLLRASMNLASSALPPAVIQATPPPAGVRAPLALPGRYNPACVAGLMAGAGISGQLVFHSGWLDVACHASGAPVLSSSALPRGAAWLKRFAVITPHCLWIAKSPGDMADISKRTQVLLPLSPQLCVRCPPPSTAFPLRPRAYSSPRRNSAGATSTRLEALSAFGSALDVAAAVSSRGRRFRGDISCGFMAFVAEEPSAVLSFLDDWWQGADTGAVPPFAWPVASEMLAMHACSGGALDAASSCCLGDAVPSAREEAGRAAPNSQLRSYQLQHLMNTAGLLLRRYCRGSAMQRAAACLLPESDPFAFSPAAAKDLQRSARIELQTPKAGGKKVATVHLRLGHLADRALWAEALLLAAGQRCSSGAAFAVPKDDLGAQQGKKSQSPGLRLWGAARGASPGKGVAFGGVSASASSTPRARHAPENTPHMPLVVTLVSAARSRLLGDAASAVQALVLQAAVASTEGGAPAAAAPPSSPRRARHKRMSTALVLNDAATAMLRSDGPLSSAVQHSRSATIAGPIRPPGFDRSMSSPDVPSSAGTAAIAPQLKSAAHADIPEAGILVLPEHPLTAVLQDVLSGPLTVPLEWYHWSRDKGVPQVSASTDAHVPGVAASALSAAYGSGSSGTVSLGAQDASLAQLIKDLGRDSLTLDGMYPLQVLELSNPAVLRAAEAVRSGLRGKAPQGVASRASGGGGGQAPHMSTRSDSQSANQDTLDMLSDFTLSSPTDAAAYEPAHKARLMLQAVATRVLAAAGEEGSVFENTAAALAFARHVLLSCGRTVAGFDAFDVVQQLLVPASLPDQVRDATVTAPWSGHDAPMDLHIINVQQEAVAVTRQLVWLRSCVVDSLAVKWRREWQGLLSDTVPRSPVSANTMAPSTRDWAAAVLEAQTHTALAPATARFGGSDDPPPSLHLPARKQPKLQQTHSSKEQKVESAASGRRQELRERLQAAVRSAALAVQASPHSGGQQPPLQATKRRSAGGTTPQPHQPSPAAEYKMRRRSSSQRPSPLAAPPPPPPLAPQELSSDSDSEDSLQGLSDMGSLDGLDGGRSSGGDSSDLEADSDFDDDGAAGGAALSPEQLLHKRWQDELAVGTSLPFLLALLHPQVLRRLSVAGDLVRHRIGCDEVYVAVEGNEETQEHGAASPARSVTNATPLSPSLGALSPSQYPLSPTAPRHRNHSLSAVPVLRGRGNVSLDTSSFDMELTASLAGLVGLRSSSLPASDSDTDGGSDDENDTRQNPLRNTGGSRHRRSATMAVRHRMDASSRRQRAGTDNDAGLSQFSASRHLLGKGGAGGGLNDSRASSVRSASQRAVAPRPWWWLGHELPAVHVHDVMQGSEGDEQRSAQAAPSKDAADVLAVSTNHIPSALLAHFSCVNAYRLMNADADFGDGRDSTVARLAVRYLRTFVVDGRNKPPSARSDTTKLHAHVPNGRMLRAAGCAVGGATCSKPHVSVVGVPGGRAKQHEAQDLEELQTAARSAWGAWIHLNSAGELAVQRT